MSVRPRPSIAVALAVAYLGIVAATWGVLGIDYTEVGDTTDTVVGGIVIPVALGSVFLAVATSTLGWWRPALRKELGAPRGCGSCRCSCSCPASVRSWVVSRSPTDRGATSSPWASGAC